MGKPDDERMWDNTTMHNTYEGTSMARTRPVDCSRACAANRGWQYESKISKITALKDIQPHTSQHAIGS